MKRGSTRRVFEPLSFAITTGHLSKRSFRRKLLVRDTRSPFPKYGRCASFDTMFTLTRSTPYFGYTFIKIILNDFYFTLPAGGANKKTIKRWSFLFATLGLEPMLKHTVPTKGVPLQSHSRKLSPRYTQLYLLRLASLPA